MPEIFYKHLQQQLEESFPRSFLSLDISSLERLVSPFQLKIPKYFFEKSEEFIRTIFRVSRERFYVEYTERKSTDQDIEILNFPSHYFSQLMAYDFHLNFETGEIKLIEINTNGAGYLFAALAQEAHNILNQKTLVFQSSHPLPTQHSHSSQSVPTNESGALQSLALENLRKSFEEEMDLCGVKRETQIGIIDEELTAQKMYVEFLMYEELFKSWGYSAKSYDVSELKYENGKVLSPEGTRLLYIYNRYCDFLLQKEVSQGLRNSYLNGRVALSPQPREYLLLADKQRMIDWNEDEFTKNLSEQDRSCLDSIVLKTSILNDSLREEAWSRRKHLFFKPQRSFGGKSTYKGESISRKVFERLLGEESLAQELFPPQKVNFDGQDWKFDFRVYVYKDRPLFHCARLYQGQVTNFNTRHGGFCSVVNFPDS